MSTKGQTKSIGDAVRDVRRALGLRQSEIAARVHVSRETVSSWEQGRTAPSHEQRVAIVTHLADAPSDVLQALVRAFGIAAPPSVKRSRKPSAVAGRALAPILAAADELDVPASVLRRTLSIVLSHLEAAGVSLDDVAAHLTPPGASENQSVAPTRARDRSRPFATARNRSEPLATSQGTEPTDADVEAATVRAVTMGLGQVARTLAAQLEARRQTRAGNVVSIDAKRRRGA